MTSTSAENPATPPLPVSVVILTLNEEINISDCLASCDWSDDVHVLDSCSTDQTVPIAQSKGVQVHINPFQSFGAQRNWAIENIPLKHDWVFHLDADERFTPEILEEMRALIAANPPEAGFYVPSKLMFRGRWLRRTGGYPAYQMRLFHKSRMRFHDYGHGQRELTTGSVGRLHSPYLHFNFSKGLEDWFEKHNRYSTQEARRIAQDATEPLRLRDIFNKDPVRKRRVLKRIWYRLPFRPTLRWLIVLFFQGGILEGRPGRTYARLIMIYEQMIQLKLRDLHAHQPNKAPINTT